MVIEDKWIIGSSSFPLALYLTSRNFITKWHEIKLNQLFQNKQPEVISGKLGAKKIYKASNRETWYPILNVEKLILRNWVRFYIILFIWGIHKDSGGDLNLWSFREARSVFNHLDILKLRDLNNVKDPFLKILRESYKAEWKWRKMIESCPLRHENMGCHHLHVKGNNHILNN